MKNNVVKKLIAWLCLFVAVITIIFISGVIKVKQTGQTELNNKSRELIVELNEIDNLIKNGQQDTARQQIVNIEDGIRQNILISDDNNTNNKSNVSVQKMTLIYVFSLAVVLLAFFYLYRVIIRPFKKLEGFADEIAKGNFNVQLDYERTNIFGAFTWAFDHMKNEIVRARAGEKEAIENNKTVIATLSHDIKTPIASIRAYAEGLEANMDTSIERRDRYIRVIMKKCDQVTELTNDLFIHSLSDLDKLKISTSKVQIKDVITNAIEQIDADNTDVVVDGEIISSEIYADSKRVAQVIENIINNSRKYANGSKIHIWTEKSDDKNKTYIMHFKDGGPGIMPQDMPFVFEKFYRGKNCADNPGAGLGLYIVKYIMTQMNGSVKLINHNDGLEVILELPYIE